MRTTVRKAEPPLWIRGRIIRIHAPVAYAGVPLGYDWRELQSTREV